MGHWAAPLPLADMQQGGNFRWVCGHHSASQGESLHVGCVTGTTCHPPELGEASESSWHSLSRTLVLPYLVTADCEAHALLTEAHLVPCGAGHVQIRRDEDPAARDRHAATCTCIGRCRGGARVFLGPCAGMDVVAAIDCSCPCYVTFDVFVLLSMYK